MPPRRRPQKALPPAVPVTVMGNARDALLARIAEARRCAQSVLDACDDVVELCIETEDDDDGGERTDLIEGALDMAGSCSRALELAEEVMIQVNPTEVAPWDDGDEED